MKIPSFIGSVAHLGADKPLFEGAEERHVLHLAEKVRRNSSFSCKCFRFMFFFFVEKTKNISGLKPARKLDLYVGTLG